MICWIRGTWTRDRWRRIAITTITRQKEAFWLWFCRMDSLTWEMGFFDAVYLTICLKGETVKFLFGIQMILLTIYFIFLENRYTLRRHLSKKWGSWRYFMIFLFLFLIFCEEFHEFHLISNTLLTETVWCCFFFD